MTNIYNQIFEAIASAVETEYPEIDAHDELVLSPTVFPSICIEEADNYVHTPSSDSGNIENASVLMYEVNVYTNDVIGKRAKARAILNIADKVLGDFGFRRMSAMPITINDNTIFRLFCRYTAIVGKDNIIYRRG